MHRVIVQTYLKLGMSISDMRWIFSHEKTRQFGTMFRHKSEEEINDDSMFDKAKTSHLTATLATTRDFCRELGLSVSRRMIKRALVDLPQTDREFNILTDTVMSEMKNTLFLFVPPHAASYYERDDLVTDAVVTAFPKASEEIRLAGTCFAAGLGTSCVFHAMRAAEIGVRALATAMELKLKHSVELEDWQAIQNSAKARIEEIGQQRRSDDRDKDLEFYSQACAQFQFFKDGWRVRVMHARASYTEPQAKDAIDHVRSFFEILASRLRESLS